jgi:hypothetical protein
MVRAAYGHVTCQPRRAVVTVLRCSGIAWLLLTAVKARVAEELEGLDRGASQLLTSPIYFYPEPKLGPRQ